MKRGLNVRIDRKYFSRDEERLSVLKDVAFEVPSGKVAALVGPSGCGKTTLLNLIAGLDTDYEGEIHLPNAKNSVIPVSFVFQEPRLLPWRSVQENVSLVFRGRSRENNQKVTDMLAKVGLTQVADHFPQSLSLGMARRVSLARGFIVEAPVLLMDEPFVSLDSLTANRLRKMLLQRLEETCPAVLFVTHDLREALYLADDLLLLSRRPATVETKISLVGSRGRSEEKIAEMRREIIDQHPDLE